MKYLPTNDEEYDQLMARIVKGAEYLENPLIKPHDFERGMKKYDELCAAALEYQRIERERREREVQAWSKSIA